MEEACRICFEPNLKMVKLNDSLPEKEFLECVFFSNGLEGEMIESLCYLCKALLSKSYRFVQKALKAQQAFLNNDKIVTKDTWDSLRDECKFAPTLSYHHKIGIDIFLQKSDEWNPHDQVKGMLEKNKEKKALSASKYNQGSSCDDKSEGSMKKCDIKNQVSSDDDMRNEDIVTISDDSFDESEYVQSSVGKIPRKRKPQPKRKKMVFFVYTDEENKEPHPNSTEINPENVVTGKRNRVTKIISDAELSDSDPPLEKPKSGKKGKIAEENDKEFTLDDISEESTDSSDDIEMYNEKGKRLSKRPREYPRQCENCESEISASTEHYRHYLTHHTHEMYPYRKKENEYIHVCQHCGKKYINAYMLKQHEATHGKKTVPCYDLCGKMFYNFLKMRKHYKSVHKQRRLFCDYCNKGFANKSDIRLHIRIHTGEKPFKCKICGAGFAHLGNLNLHLRHSHIDMDENGKVKSFRSRPRKNNNTSKKGRARKRNVSVTDSDESEDEIVKPPTSNIKKRKSIRVNEKVKRKTEDENEQQKEKGNCKLQPRQNNNISKKRNARKRNISLTENEESEDEILKTAKSNSKKRNSISVNEKVVRTDVKLIKRGDKKQQQREDEGVAPAEKDSNEEAEDKTTKPPDVKTRTKTVSRSIGKQSKVKEFIKPVKSRSQKRSSDSEKEEQIEYEVCKPAKSCTEKSNFSSKDNNKKKKSNKTCQKTEIKTESSEKKENDYKEPETSMTCQKTEIKTESSEKKENYYKEPETSMHCKEENEGLVSAENAQ